MKDLIELSKQFLNESTQKENLDEGKFNISKANKGREGKPMIGVNGEEVSGTVYLGGYSYLIKSRNNVEIVRDGITSKDKRMPLTAKQFKVLQKAKI